MLCATVGAVQLQSDRIRADVDTVGHDGRRLMIGAVSVAVTLVVSSIGDISPHTAPDLRAYRARRHTAKAFLVRDYD